MSLKYTTEIPYKIIDSSDSVKTDQISKKTIIELLKKHNITTNIIETQNLEPKELISILIKEKINLPDNFFRELAQALKLPYLEFSEAKKLIKNCKKIELAGIIPYQIASKYHVIPLKSCKSKAILGTTNPLEKEYLSSLYYLYATWESKIQVISTKTLNWAIEYIFVNKQKKEATKILIKTKPTQSANKVLYKNQKIMLITLTLTLMLALTINTILLAALVFSAITIFYLIINPLKIIISTEGFKGPRARTKITKGEILWTLDEDLPTYTILVPVFREATILKQIMTNIYKLNYPKEKLDVKILMEEGDKETIDEAKRIGLFGSRCKGIDGIPENEYNLFLAIFDPLIVPHGKLRTKPRACNYGLMRALGEYCVVYDAEDDPDPDQLKKAAIIFMRTEENVVCLQSKLNFYNKRENALTKWFSIEYSYWYEFYLPGLDRVDIPIPLGGTSNHFRVKQLNNLGRWDPYNMTEDADLGLRLSRNRFKTQMIESTTLEEAPISIKSWIKQRSRWHKGHLQTYIVHMRYPKQLLKDLGLIKFLKLQLTFGASIFVTLVNPILWVFTVSSFIMPSLFNLVIPNYIQAICTFNLLFGNLTYIGLYVIGNLKLKNYKQIPHSLAMPLYWIIVSIAGWRGLIQLIREPFYWDKTTHGKTTINKIQIGN